MDLPARHPKFGDCIIRRWVNSQSRPKVLVDYPRLGVSRVEFLDELLDPKTGRPLTLDESPRQTSPRPQAPAAAPTWQDARRTLLALRLGQSTPESVRELSVGMDEVESACRDALQRAASGKLSFMLFESPYGMGKSHALAVLRQRAFEAQMAVGTLVLDGVSVSLCQPIPASKNSPGLLGSLAHAIEFPDDSCDGFPHRIARRVGVGMGVSGTEFLNELLRGISAEIVDDPDKWEMIEDYLALDANPADIRRELQIRVPPIRALRRDDRPGRCANLMKEWANGCMLLGARNGLVVLLDEADVDFAQSGRTQPERDQRAGLLQAWRNIADAGPRDGGYARLVIAIAVTPGAGNDDPLEELKQELGRHLKRIVLRELNEGEMQKLGNRVCGLYRTAYELGETESTKVEKLATESLASVGRSAEQRNPRKFIRLLLEKLDATCA